MERTWTPVLVLVLKRAESSIISVASSLRVYNMRKKNISLLSGWVIAFPVSLQRFCCFLTITSTKNLCHKARPLSAVGNYCFWSPIMVSLGILGILALGERTWLGRYPHLPSVICRRLSQSLFSTGRKWTILDMERKRSHKNILLSAFRPSPGGKEPGLPRTFLFPSFKTTCF